jgi:chromosome segregation protein
MQVDRLRLVGFKSFVDATELAIMPGLTGVVGPNGCGKSNLAEALRWVMGETSAKRLRGGEMDDVIFAGTAERTARNIAEVALTIDNSARDAPFAFNDREEIEVVRRIERGGGSTYRINGREVRARDVQLLFADVASGAHSGAMVSQGRISALIEARPAERRLLLEEASGTAGLHSRRHETEHKLNAAEDNLARLDDVIATIETQFETLKKQARQAHRYRRLAEHIRRTEALLLQARWHAAQDASMRSAGELRAAERAVAEATERALVEGRAQEAAEKALPSLRLAEAAATAELQRLTQARDGLEQELQRVLATRGEAERRLLQVSADLDREGAHFADAEAALARLSDERKTLASAEAEDSPARERMAAGLQDATARLAEAERALQRATEAAAAAEAQYATLERRQRELADRRARLEVRRTAAERDCASLTAALVPPDALAAAANTLAEMEEKVERCRAMVEAAEHEIASRFVNEEAARDAARQVETQLARLTAEAEALSALLAPGPSPSGDPAIVTSLRVDPGFEAAVGAVFEDELMAPLANGGSQNAPRYWVNLAGMERDACLPEGVHPLAAAVTAPPALARSLAQAGWVESEEAGRRLQSGLMPGQRLVDRDGRLWRWDGFTSTASGQSSAAEHLRYRNRLAVLESEIAGLAAEGLATEQRAAAARAERQQAIDADKLSRLQLRDAEAALARARAVEAELARRALTTETRRAGAVDMLGKANSELAETCADLEEAERSLAALAGPTPLRRELDKARASAADERRSEAEWRAAIDRLAHHSASRRERLSAIDREERSWCKRGKDAAAQQATLRERREALEQEIAGLAARPAEIAKGSEALAGDIADAAARCRRTAEALALGETRLREAVEGSRRSEQALAEIREQRARLEVMRDGATEESARLAREIGERLGVVPEGLGELAGLAADEAPADAAETAARLDRLVRERDNIGPVNLMAENEAAEVEMRMTNLRGERADLTEAIARLRRGIAALDQEMRRRLTAAFERVNTHFGELFVRLFGGGKAHLALVDDEDLLAAGLEIMASPPGKRLQSLSLLSGGEQALTALALIFAVFLTNPAPVCVLDEVDAPLDDANVDRFCSLVGEIADSAGTRFVVVTHHRITMARVDRLLGVTMAERGVSQLVSVDLARAAQLRQTA